MWLINTKSLNLEAVPVSSEHSEQYRYAILSHTWEDGEVTFQDMADLPLARTKPGFAKIEQTCRLAYDRGILYAWVDTCCIDKNSSAELSEAINSMFRWYKESAVCFVYLADLRASFRTNIMTEIFRRCRWFTRGWTLQELIAPEDIEFYDQTWNVKGTKASLRQQLSEITGIDPWVLHDSSLLSSICVARRMSWAANRQTSRVEDRSYSLFGIFDVNLPLIYGEGAKAFIRLQEAIAAENNDLSLFAWTSKHHPQDVRGVLANSPSEFSSCGSIQRNTDPALKAEEFRMTNKGFHITTRLGKHKGEYYLSLQCFHNDMQRSDTSNPTMFVIQLLKTSQGYIRHGASQISMLPYPYPRPATSLHDVYIPKVCSHDDSWKLRIKLALRFGIEVRNTSNYNCDISHHPSHLWNADSNNFITEGHEQFTALLKIRLHMTKKFDKKMCHHSSEYLAFFGLNDGNAETQFSEHAHRNIKTWAAIFDMHLHESQSRFSAEEEEHRLCGILATKGAILRKQLMSGQTLPSAVESPVQFLTTNKSGEVFHEDKSIHISVSTSVDNRKYEPYEIRDMFRLVLKIESK